MIIMTKPAYACRNRIGISTWYYVELGHFHPVVYMWLYCVLAVPAAYENTNSAAEFAEDNSFSQYTNTSCLTRPHANPIQYLIGSAFVLNF